MSIYRDIRQLSETLRLRFWVLSRALKPTVDKNGGQAFLSPTDCGGILIGKTGS